MGLPQIWLCLLKEAVNECNIFDVELVAWLRA